MIRKITKEMQPNLIIIPVNAGSPGKIPQSVAKQKQEDVPGPIRYRQDGFKKHFSEGIFMAINKAVTYFSPMASVAALFW
jgi:hypothetical protein